MYRRKCFPHLSNQIVDSQLLLSEGASISLHVRCNGQKVVSHFILSKHCCDVWGRYAILLGKIENRSLKHLRFIFIPTPRWLGWLSSREIIFGHFPRCGLFVCVLHPNIGLQDGSSEYKNQHSQN